MACPISYRMLTSMRDCWEYRKGAGCVHCRSPMSAHRGHDRLSSGVTISRKKRTMSIIRVIVRQPWATTAPKGPLSSNTYHFDTKSNLNVPAAATACAEAALALYQIDTPVILGSVLAGNAEWSAYNLDDLPDLLPIAIGSQAMEVGTTSLPGEVAANISFKAPRQLGVPSQRARGSIQLGPLDPGVLTADGNISAAAGAAIASAVGFMVAAVETASCEWVVGSPAHGFHQVTEAHVKNECGTVSKRQLAATQIYPVAL